MAEKPSKSLILDVTSEHVDHLFSKWSYMFDFDCCMDLLQKLKERVNNFYQDLLAESEEKEQMIWSDISALKTEIAEVNRLLHKNLDVGEMPEDMPLTVWHHTLDNKVEHLREELQKRRDEICELLLQQEQLCEELGEPPLPLLADPLPKPQEISAFCEHLERLRTERMRRIDELFQLRSQIKQYMKVLELMPQTDADERLLSQGHHCLTPDILEKLRFMNDEFKSQVVELQERIDDMRAKIKILWERLPDTDEFAMRRVREAQEYTQRTYDVLHEELLRCQELRRQNLKSFIEKLRVEIEKWWDLTLKSQQERKRFSNFYNQWYNEDLLELHEMELDDIKSFYNVNKEIFDLFASRGEIWARMVALEAKASDPNRFNNRGGQLLKEERERKAISSKLPKIEQQITELVQAYEQRTNSPFLVHGENILEHMAKDWERHRQAKEQQSSARKADPTGPGKMLPPPTPGSKVTRTPLALKNMSALSSSTMSLRRTPSNWQLSSTKGSAAKTTGNLHKRKLASADTNARTETPNAKRSLVKTLNSMKDLPARKRLATIQQRTMKSPLKKVLVLEGTLRRSSGLGRRSVGNSNKARSRQQKPRTAAASGDENEEYTTTDENPIGQEEICNYNTFIPPARSSELPRALHVQRQLPEPRRSRMFQAMKRK